ncbi:MULTISPECIES: hypothetical protein, partial [unclassified Colwellia]|uniref:hypothetical protein n=1 Tax=unclassified Colwellia TaxID=196834 RepID=UPI001C71126D
SPPNKEKPLIERLAVFCFLKLEIINKVYSTKPSSRVQISISPPNKEKPLIERLAVFCFLKLEIINKV